MRVALLALVIACARPAPSGQHGAQKPTTPRGQPGICVGDTYCFWIEAGGRTFSLYIGPRE